MHHLIQEAVFDQPRFTSMISGSGILDWIRVGGQQLDIRFEHELSLKGGDTVDIVFTDLDGRELYPNVEEGSVDGEFFPSAHKGYVGIIVLYKSTRLQETLAHEVFHALQSVAHKGDPKLRLWEEDLWRRSEFPQGSYALRGGPLEGAAEVWRAHLGHWDYYMEDHLWVLEDEWGRYFDAVISHCW